MALVLEDDHVELMQMSALGNRPVGTLRSIPYAEIPGVDVAQPLSRVARRHPDERTTRSSSRGGKHGVGAAPPVIDELRRRIAA